MQFGKFFGKSAPPPTPATGGEALSARLRAMPDTIGEQLDLIDEVLEELGDMTATLSLDAALATLMEADAAAQAPCAQMLGEYFMAGGPRAGSFALLDRLAAHTARLAGTYAQCLAPLEESGETVPAARLAPVALAYLRAWGLQRRLARFRQRPLGKLSWQQAHTIIALMRRCGAFPTQGEASGDARASLRAYLQVAYEETVPAGNLTAPQQELAARLIGADTALGWALAPTADSTHLLDLAAADGPRRLGAEAPTTGPARRFISTAPLRVAAERLLAACRKSEPLPDWLASLPLDDAARQSALTLLASHWSATPPRRQGAREERYRPMLAAFGFVTTRQLVDIACSLGRTPASQRPMRGGDLNFVSEFNRAYANLSYGDAESGNETRAANVPALLTELRQREAKIAGLVLEHWTEIDISAGGIGVLVPAMLPRHAIGTLVAWRCEDELRWHLGVIRRAGRDARERPTLGIELLPEPALPAVVQLQSARPATEKGPEWLLALVAGENPDAVLLPAGSFVAPCAVNLISDRGERSTRLSHVVERTGDWERVALADA